MKNEIESLKSMSYDELLQAAIALLENAVELRAELDKIRGIIR
jgi:hypothetical protein